MIYFIVQQNQYVKIGYTDNDPEGRLLSCQTGNPIPLQLYKVIQGGQAEERELHERFKDIRVSGEWFFFAKSLKAYIDSVMPGDIHAGYAELVIDAAAMEDWDTFKLKHQGYINGRLVDMLLNVIEAWQADKDLAGRR